MARFYLVDDEVWTLQSLESLLRPFQFVDEIRTFNNSREALEVIAADPPDVLFTDLRMDYVSGRELIGEVRKMGLNIPIVIISAYSDFDAAREALSHNVLDYLLKPIGRASLQGVMDRLEKQLQENSTKTQVEQILRKVEDQYPECWVLAWRSDDQNVKDQLRSGEADKWMLSFDEESHHGMHYAYLSTPSKHLPESFAKLGASVGYSRPRQGFSEYDAMCAEAEASALHRVRYVNSQRISDVQVYLLQNYEKTQKLEELAARFYMNKTYLCNMFRKECGVTIITFLRDIRMVRAADLLRNTNEPVQSISASVGYSDSAYFTKMFRRMYNVSPENYRRGAEK